MSAENARARRGRSPSWAPPCASATSPRAELGLVDADHVQYLRALEGGRPREVGGEALMAAPAQDGVARPAGAAAASLCGPRRGGARRPGVDGRIRLLRFVFIVFLVLVGGKAVALASIVREPHAASPWRSRRPRSCCRRIAARSSTATATSWPSASRSRRCSPRRTCSTTREAAARALCDALQINADASAARSRRRSRGRARAGSPTWRARSTRTLAKAALALDLPGRRQLRRGGARPTRMQGLGGAGARLRRRRRPGPRRHRDAVRGAARRRGRQRGRSCATRPAARSGPCAQTEPDVRRRRAPHARRGHPVHGRGRAREDGARLRRQGGQWPSSWTRAAARSWPWPTSPRVKGNVFARTRPRTTQPLRHRRLRAGLHLQAGHDLGGAGRRRS